jgi:hypothetical protein
MIEINQKDYNEKIKCKKDVFSFYIFYTIKKS